jgi:hypothetical protein
MRFEFFIVLALVVSLCVVTARADGDGDGDESEFSQFVERHGKSYHTAQERQERRAVWQQNRQRIAQLNALHAGTTSFTADNQFGDMTEAELRALLLMHAPVPSRQAARAIALHDEPLAPTARTGRATPKAWNWCNTTDFALGCTPVVR